MSYGYFDDDAREYVITTPRTPYPWINYLGMEEFFGLISNTGGGYTFFRDALMRRLIRLRYNNVPTDAGGRCYYSTTAATSGPRPGHRSAQSSTSSRPARHVLHVDHWGAQRHPRRGHVLRAPRCHGEIHGFADQHHRLCPVVHLFSFAEFCLWNAADDSTNFQRNLSSARSRSRAARSTTRPSIASAAITTRSTASTPQSRDSTPTGRVLRPPQQRAAPEAVVEGKSRNSIASGWAPVGSHQLDIELAPGEQRDLMFVLGYVENAEDEKWESPGVINKTKAEELLARFSTSASVDAALAELRDYWSGLLATPRYRAGTRASTG